MIDFKSVRNDNDPNIKPTGDSSGEVTKELMDKAVMVTETSSIRKLFDDLIKNKTGTNGVEEYALDLVNERFMKEKKLFKKVDMNACRDPEVVVNILKIKFKHAVELEEEAKKDFEKELKKVERSIEKGTRRNRKLRNKIRNAQNEKWEELTNKFNSKVEGLVKKYKEKTDVDRVKEEEDLLIAGVKVEDKELDLRGETKPKVEVFGKDVGLDVDEKAILIKHPKFAVFGKIDRTKMREEMEATCAKIRWERRINGTGKEENEDVETEEEEEDKIELELREIFNPEEGSLDMTKRLVTDTKTNQRIFLPGPRPAKEEAELLVRRMTWERTTELFIQQYCKENGELTESNLSDKEKSGLKKILKRIKNGEIVVTQTDKSGKLAVNSYDSFVEQGRKHVKDDKEINWKEATAYQNHLSGHTRVLVKVFNVGAQWGEKNEQRVVGAYTTKATVIPVLTTMPKDHKPLDENGDPKTRPVCKASSCANGRISDLVSDVLDKVANVVKDTAECKSTEEMLNKIEEAVKVILEKGENVIVSSEDVSGLFPNLEIKMCSKICADAVRHSELKFEGVDYIWAAKYIAMTCSREEIRGSKLEGIVPVRKYRKGTSPGVTSVEAKGKKKEGEKEEIATKWKFSRTDFTEQEKRELLAKVVEVAVRTTFKLHMYQFEGVMRLQKEGGPIGLRLTGVVARLVMQHWESKFRQLAEENHLEIYMFAWYVDDVNLIMKSLGKGWRWNGIKLEWREEWESEDCKLIEEDDVRTMREVKKMSDSILPIVKTGKSLCWTFRCGKRRGEKKGKTE